MKKAELPSQFLLNNKFWQSDCVTFLNSDKSEFAVNTSRNNWYKFKFRKLIDISSFPTGNSLLVPKLNIKKSRQFSYTNRGVVERFRSKPYIKKLIDELPDNKVKLRTYLEQLLKEGTILPVQDIDTGPVLYHATGMTYNQNRLFFGKKKLDNVDVMRTKGVYGSTRRVTYITRDFFRAIAHSPKRNGSEILLLVLSTKSLKEKRSIFIDPESLWITEEFMKNFTVPGGIPVSAVTQAYHFTCEGEMEND